MLHYTTTKLRRREFHRPPRTYHEKTTQPTHEIRTNPGISIVKLEFQQLFAASCSPERDGGTEGTGLINVMWHVQNGPLSPNSELGCRSGCSSSRYCCGSVDTSMSSDKRALDELDALFRDVPAKAVCSSSRPATKLCDGGKASPPSTAAKPRSGAKRKRGGGAGTGGSYNIVMFASICCDGQLAEETNCTITDNSCCLAKLHKRCCSISRIGDAWQHLLI